MKQLSVEHLLGIKYLNKNDTNLIFEAASHFKEVINRPIKKVPSLRDITIANLFFEDSTRTKLSFELAGKRLSADIINFSSKQSSVKKGESLIDTVNNILSMKVDIVIMRHPCVGAGVFLMILLNVVHPPAGGNPIMVIIGSASYEYLINPIIFGCIIILILAILKKRFL